MTRLQTLLTDRKRAQRGSVLSGVLIMVAFLSILAGALMTELSTNLLISRFLVDKVANEATVNSGMELALDQLQSTNVNSFNSLSPCPNLNPVAPDGRTVAVTFASCWPTVDRRSPQFVPIPSSNPFTIDGMHAVIRSDADLYLVGDSGGTVYQFTYGNATNAVTGAISNWSRSLGATISGPPLVTPDVSSIPSDVTNLIPISNAQSTGCQANACVELLGQDIGRTPDVSCFMAANAPVTSRPASGVAFPKLAFFGDQSGHLYAYKATESGNCAAQGSVTVPGTNPAVVAGPIVFKNGGNDEILVVIAAGATTRVVHYTYNSGQSPQFSLGDSPLTINASNAVGLAVEPNVLVRPRVAIAFGGGSVAMVRLDGNYDPSQIGSVASLGSAIWDAPYWCQCPTGDLIGVGVDGTFNLLNTSLGVVASFAAASGSSIRTTPGVDAAGDWFFGADNDNQGNLYEMQLQSPSSLTNVVTFGSASTPIRSAPVVSGCPLGICIYLGSTNGNAYLVPLDARDAVLTACISATPPNCSTANPHLWAQVEVGVTNSPRTVHVQGWSYYSP